MTVDDLIARIKPVLRKIQEISDRPCEEITDETVPIGDLHGFDSLNSIEAMMMLSAEINFEIPGDGNLFVSENGRRALTVHGIAERIKKLLPKE